MHFTLELSEVRREVMCTHEYIKRYKGNWGWKKGKEQKKSLSELSNSIRNRESRGSMSGKEKRDQKCEERSQNVAEGFQRLWRYEEELSEVRFRPTSNPSASYQFLYHTTSCLPNKICHLAFSYSLTLWESYKIMCIQKSKNWPHGARPTTGTALCH
jgi:hypothetical protein